MLSVIQIDQLKTSFILQVRERYGIFLISPDVTIVDDEVLVIIVKGSKFYSLEKTDGPYPVASIMQQIFEQDFDAKSKLVELKLKSLENIMFQQMSEIKSRLREKYTGKTYEVQVVSLGYEGSSWMTAEEAQFGYPDFGVQIKDSKRFCCEYKIDSDNPKRFFDLENILTRLDHQIASSF